MIYSNSKKIVFARGIKTASTSLSNALSPYRSPFEQSLVFKSIRRFTLLNSYYPFYDFSNHPHISLAKAKKILPRNAFESSTKFAVLREPVDWMVSVYKHWLLIYKGLDGYGNKYSINSLEDFILYRMDNIPPLQCLLFFDVDGFILTDFIGNFHQLKGFTGHLEQLLDLTLEDRRLNISSPHVKVKVSRKDQALIERACNLDYNLFDFDNVNNIFITKKDDYNLNNLETCKKILRDSGGVEFDPWKFEI